MRTYQKAEIPVQDDANNIKRCRDMLLDALLLHKGIHEIALDAEQALLSVTYDPDLISLEIIDRLAQQSDVQLGLHYEDCSLRLSGTQCASCARHIEKELRLMPGVPQASVNVAAGIVRVEFVSEQTNVQQIKDKISELGYRVDAAHDDMPPAIRRRERLEPLLVAINLATLIIGFVLSLLDVPSWIVTVLAVTSYVAGGYYGTQDGLRTLRQLRIDVNLLMIIAALGAAVIGNWPEGATLLFLFSLSNVLQAYAIGRSRKAIRSLLDLRPATATVQRGDQEKVIPVEELRLTDIVIVRPGERIPADGIVLSGQSSIDQSTITGESMPVSKEPGSTVFAGTVNQHGALELKVSKLAKDTTLAKIIQMVEEAQARRAPTQRFIDTFEQYYATFIIIAVTAYILIPVFALGYPFNSIFNRAMILLVVASPCALVISTPASILSAIANAAQKGVLFKGGVHLENAATIQVVAFDKTGTLTLGRPQVADVLPLNEYTENQLLEITACAESRSEHLLAEAVLRKARANGLTVGKADSFEAVPGLGVRAQVGPDTVLVGNERFMAQHGLELPADIAAQKATLESQGKTALLVHNHQWAGLLGISDQVRPDAAAAVAAIKKTGVKRVVMLTGDNERVAEAVANTVGVDQAHANLLPQDKVTLLKQLEAEYGAVAMVGDGVNDAPALAISTIGIAMGAAGTDVALETADVVLMADDLARIPFMLQLAKRTRRIVWQNIGFSVLVVVLLIGGTFVTNLPLPLGVVGHEGSTIIVVLNGLRLLAFGRGQAA